MPVMSTVKVAQLNFVIHPHPAGAYQNLLKAMISAKKIIKYRGSDYLLFRSMRKYDDRYLIGDIARFTNLDPDAPWFSYKNLDVADQEVKIPEGLYPNMKLINYMFDRNNHKMLFETYHSGHVISPMSLQSFFTTLIKYDEIKREYPNIKISLVSDHESVRSLLKMPLIRKLRLEIGRPNPADGADSKLDEDIQKRLGEQRASKVEIGYTAESGRSIQPDQRTKDLAALAAENGLVEVTGKNKAGVSGKFSSQNFPLILSGQYEGKVQTEAQGFAKVVMNLE